MKDWRITNQKNYLTNVKLMKVDTTQMLSDHEHCVFCWDKFIKNEDVKIDLYATTDFKHWICEKCYNDLKKEFGWDKEESNNILSID